MCINPKKHPNRPKQKSLQPTDTEPIQAVAYRRPFSLALVAGTKHRRDHAPPSGGGLQAGRGRLVLLARIAAPQLLSDPTALQVSVLEYGRGLLERLLLVAGEHG